MEDEIKDEILFDDNIVDMKNVYNICKASIKILRKDGGVGTGFFLKFERNEKMFYCIMTNEHVITSKMIEDGNEIIIIFYENEQKSLEVKLDKKERFIKEFKTELNIDVMILEIIEKDNVIDNVYFLKPYKDYDEDNEKFLDEDIQIVQYPEGKLSLSNGKILKKGLDNEFLFYHDANTMHGSSGSPIVLKGEEKVIAIHKGSSIKFGKNVGFFIGIIIDIMKTYRKKGEGKEFYKNGMLKYEGNFYNDEYNGEGIEYYENGDKKYEGKFINGKYNGEGIEYYENGDKKYEGKFVDGEYNGEGKFFEENKEIYIGEFKNGKKNGNGCVFKGDELIKEGNFENNIFLDDEKELNEENEDNQNDNNEEVENKNEEEENDDNSDNVPEKEDDNQNNSNNINNNNNNNNYNIYNSNNINNNNINNNNIYNNNNNFNNNINNNRNITNNNNIYNNIFNNITNININNNNNCKNKNNDFLKNMKTHVYHVLHPIGNLIGVRCSRCGHLVKSHIPIEFDKWNCVDCPKNDNICIKG